MKKIILSFVCTFLCFNFSYSYADTDVDPGSAVWTSSTSNSPTANAQRTINITVTEKIPGITCVAQKKEYDRDETGQDYTYVDDVSANAKSSRYRCEVPIGMWGALLFLGSMIRWLTVIALLCSVLFLVFNGIRLSMSWIDGEAKWKVKGQIFMTLWGIILLLLSGPILKIIAPWIYR